MVKDCKQMKKSGNREVLIKATVNRDPEPEEVFQSLYAVYYESVNENMKVLGKDFGLCKKYA